MLDTKEILNINDNSFPQLISKGVSLIDFWAEWCMPCRLQTPILNEVAKKIGDKVRVAKINVDDNPLTPTQYGITGIPTLIVFKDGQEIKRMVGVQDEKSLLTFLEGLTKA